MNPLYPAGCTTADHDAAWGEGSAEEPTRTCMRPGCSFPMDPEHESGDCRMHALEGDIEVAREELEAIRRAKPFPMTQEHFSRENRALIKVHKLYGAIQAHKGEVAA